MVDRAAHRGRAVGRRLVGLGPQDRADAVLRLRAVRQQRGCRGRGAAGEHTRAGQRERVVAGEPRPGQLALGRARRGALLVRQNHRAERGGDEQRAGDLEGEQVVGEQQPGDPDDVALLVDLLEADRGDRAVVLDDRARDGPHQQGGEAQADDEGRDALPAQGLHEGVAGVHADEHQDEQEQHEDGAGVDDHLHGGQEGGVLGGVQPGQAEHHAGQEQRGVHRALAQHHHDGRDHGQRGEHPEGDRLAGRGGGQHRLTGHRSDPPVPPAPT